MDDDWSAPTRASNDALRAQIDSMLDTFNAEKSALLDAHQSELRRCCSWCRYSETLISADWKRDNYSPTAIEYTQGDQKYGTSVHRSELFSGQVPLFFSWSNTWRCKESDRSAAFIRTLPERNDGSFPLHPR
ncbi:hypothetical protein ACTWPB_04085 [Nocardia sp. IBHARD005]|uniref:hypothetical protein n=1 Tax=Nocardia sp. IBHARD005 TaxID=3457765 RepID=UPI0040592F22